MRSLHLLACATLLAGPTCLPGQQPQAQPPEHIPGGYAPPMLRPFTQQITGTTVTIDMVPVPAGSITISNARVKGQVETIDIPELWVSTTEITWDAYDIFCFKLDQENQETGAGNGEDVENKPDAITRPSKPYIPPDRGYGHAGYPVISETCKGAQEFCKWLSAKTGRTYRLPTEAEWEYIARAGGNLNDRFTYGDDEAVLGDYAWYNANAERKTHPVAQKKPSAWGLFDVHGNVAEWAIRADGKPVTCGGSFLSTPAQVGLKMRQLQSPLWNVTDPNMPKSTWWLSDCDFVGFRIVCEPTPDQRATEDEDQP